MCEPLSKAELIDGAEISAKECFANCQRILMQVNRDVLSRFSYIEGYLGEHPHAWIEYDDGVVWDPTRDAAPLGTWTTERYRKDEGRGSFSGTELWEHLDRVRQRASGRLPGPAILVPFRPREVARDDDGDEVVVRYSDVGRAR